jgi:uncharacterized membrane protein YedE/YeeE
MREQLLAFPPWYVAGPAIGLVLIGLVATINQRVGVVGGYTELIERATGRKRGFGWKAWFLFGVIGGGVLFSLLSGAWRSGEAYGWLSAAFASDGDVAVPIGLTLAGVLIGFGAKTAGGCTSGNGLSGCSAGSPASMVATGVFMGTAIAAAFLTSVLFGWS